MPAHCVYSIKNAIYLTFFPSPFTNRAIQVYSFLSTLLSIFHKDFFFVSSFLLVVLVFLLGFLFLFGFHCAKDVPIRSYSGPYIPAFALNTERYRVVSLRIQSECGKIQTRVVPNTDTFHEVFSVQITMLKYSLDH